MSHERSDFSQKIMYADKRTEPVEIFAGTTWQAALVKSLLDDAEIEAFLENEIIGTLFPWVTAPGGAGSMKVFVSKLDYEKAKSVVEEYEKKKKNC
jgi:hypothetical protein